MPDQDVRGKSLLDLLVEQLDGFVDELQEQAEDGAHGALFMEARGRAHAAAVCVALATNPYNPQVAAIKSEAMDRWSDRTGQPEEPQDDNEAARRYEARRARRQARRAARNS